VKIALIGYGKMGKEIEKIALQRNHTISHRFSSNTPFIEQSACDADVAIEFTLPSCAAAHINQCLDLEIPVVSGTTGWMDELPAIHEKTKHTNGAVLYASNFSLGVHLFFEMSKKMGALMNNRSYETRITETHHTEKKDMPSGTAISTAEVLLKELSNYNSWSLEEGQTIPKDAIPINSIRTENVPGTHEVSFTSEIDTIALTHTANNRKGFALGAVIAAEWILDKKGLFTMADVLNLK
tara:strand:+ start:4171 stop:4887 length:717 start_codon:yes stop_codon:yes gene_type:complete